MRSKLLAFPAVCFLTLSACNDSPQAPPAIASVQIDPVPAETNLHVGDTFQMTARVLDAAGNELSDAVTWSSSNPTAVSVSADGLLTVLARGSGIVSIRAAVNGFADTELVRVGGWTFVQGIDPVTSLRFASARLEANVGPEGPNELRIRCAEELLSVSVKTRFVVSSGDVGYRFDGVERTEEWIEAVNFQSVFYPFDVEVFAEELAASDTLLFNVEKFDSGNVALTFVLVGLEPLVPQVLAACP